LQLQTATTKNEAIDCAVNAADNLLKALKLSSNPDEKKTLKAQVTAIFDTADHIKAAKTWTPPSKPQSAQHGSKSEMIGQWAADVALTSHPVDHVQDVPQSNASRASCSGTTASTDTLRAVPRVHGKLSTASDVAHGTIADTSPGAPATDLREQYFTENSKAPAPAVTATKDSIVNTEKNKSLSMSPVLADYAHIHRLPEPVSKRKRTKREAIILLKASVFNGFKCPPWDKSPESAEFVFNSAVGPFV
jgi:calpain-7